MVERDFRHLAENIHTEGQAWCLLATTWEPRARPKLSDEHNARLDLLDESVGRLMIAAWRAKLLSHPKDLVALIKWHASEGSAPANFKDLFGDNLAGGWKGAPEEMKTPIGLAVRHLLCHFDKSEVERRVACCLWLANMIGHSSLQQSGPHYVDLDQMAAAVHQSKTTLERRKRRKLNPLPQADVRPVKGKKHLWDWDKIRRWLETEFGMRLSQTRPQVLRRPHLRQPPPSTVSRSPI